MTDISMFKKMLATERALPRRKRIWLCAYKSKFVTDRFQYHLWLGPDMKALYEFSTFNLEHARTAAELLGETVFEHGPPEAFRRPA
jgi:hypothetical protein